MVFQAKRPLVSGVTARKGRFGSGLRRGLYSALVRTLLLDHFTDVNGTQLTAHVMDKGPGWVVLNGAGHIPTIQSNKATTLDGAGDEDLTSESGNSTVTVSATLRFVAINGRPGLFLRTVDNLNYWVLQLNYGSAALELVDVTAGAPLVRATSPFTFVTGVDYVTTFIASGTVLTGSFVGGPTVSFSSSVRQTGTLCGIRLSSPSGGGDTIDDFQVTTP